MATFTRFLPAALLASSCLLPAVLMAGETTAEENAAEEENIKKLPELDTIVVRARAEEDTVITKDAKGEYRLDRKKLDDFGGATGSITDALKMLPGIQFSEDALKPDALADLKPESISISGGRVYENSFLLDGLSMDSRLDPLADTVNSISSVPGHEQSMFIDLNMLESLTVYESNVPAAYGRFTGGVVEAKSKKPGGEKELNWNYSTTRSDWVKYRVFTVADPTNPTPPEPPRPGEFVRERMGLGAVYPVGETSFITSLNRSYSSTPDISLGKSKAREQENLSLLGKMASPLGNDSTGSLALTYAPYSSTQFLKDIKDSDFTITGGGMSLSGNLETAFASNDSSFGLNVGLSENSRQAPRNFFNWENTASKHWGIENDVSLSREGGYGDIDKQQLSAGLRWATTQHAFTWGGLETTLEYGGDINHQQLEENRLDTSYIYKDSITNTGIDCRGVTLDCVNHEQYFTSRQIYEAGDVEVTLLQYSLHMESRFKYRRLDTTLGLRYDQDNFLKNNDIAPRFRGSLDVFGSGKTQLLFGANRYYGAPLLSYKLREARAPYRTEYRGAYQNIINEWSSNSGQGSYRYVFDDIRSPYSDELTLGIKQSVLGGQAELRYVSRKGHDELAQTVTDVQADGYQWYLMNNEGSSRYQGLSLAWYRDIGQGSIGLHATWSESETSNNDYDSAAEYAEVDEEVWYNGKRVRLNDLLILRSDYSRPLIAGVTLAWQFPAGIRASLLTNYRGKYPTIAETGKSHNAGTITLPDGSVINDSLVIYEDREKPATLISDLKLSWKLGDKPSLAVNLNVNNVLNARSYTVDDGNPSTTSSGIETGRNFWLGLSGRF